MRSLLLVGLGGCIGAIGRYVIGEFVKQRIPTHPHVGTFVVNMLGCLLIGFVMSLSLGGESTASQQTWRLLIVTGCLGALTTFSTFGFETVTLLQENRVGDALTNVAGNLLIGLPFVWLGMQLAKVFGAPA